MLFIMLSDCTCENKSFVQNLHGLVMTIIGSPDVSLSDLICNYVYTTTNLHYITVELSG